MSRLIPNRIVSIWTPVAACLILILFGLLATQTSSRLSATFDEPIHFRAGLDRLAWLTGDPVRHRSVDPLSPPIGMIPAAVSGFPGTAAEHVGHSYLLRGRLVSLATGIIVLLTVFLWSSKLFGTLSGLFSMFVLATNPLFIGHSSIISTDLYGAAGAILMVTAAWIVVRARASGVQFVLLASLLLGFAFSFALICKITNVVPLALVLLWIVWRLLQTKGRGAALGIVSLSLAVCLLTAGFIYQAGGQHLYWPGETDGGFNLSQTILSASDRAANGNRVFSFGTIQSGSLYHYVLALVIKTPVPLLVLISITIALAFRSDATSQFQAVRLLLTLALATAAVWGSFGGYLGLRQWLLPICLGSVAVGIIPELLRDSLRHMSSGLRRSMPIALLGILIWCGVEAIRAGPWQLQYFNQFTRTRWSLIDSDGDWGQGLIDLHGWQEQQGSKAKLYLAYFGNVDPATYGIRYEPLPAPIAWSAESVGSKNLQEIDGFVAVSLTLLTGKYLSVKGYDRDFYRRFAQAAPRWTVGGGSIRVYDQRRHPRN